MERRTPYELLKELVVNVDPTVDSCILMNYLIDFDRFYVGFLEKFGWKNVKVLTSWNTDIPAEIQKQLKENLKIIDSEFFGGILHGKCCLFTVGGEKIVCVIGSFNLTNDGLNSNIESFCVLDGRYKGRKIIDYLKDNISDDEMDEVLDRIEEQPNSYIIKPLMSFLMKLWSGNHESEEFESDILLRKMQKLDRLFVHTLGKNSIKKSIQFMVQRLSKIKSDNPILIRIVSPYHSRQSFYGLVDLIEDSIQQFAHEGLSFKIELLTNLGFKEKYDKSTFTDPDFLLQLYKKEVQFPGKLQKDQIEFEFRFWDQSKRPNTEFFEKRFLHSKIFVISRNRDSCVLLTSSNFTPEGLGLNGSFGKNVEIGLLEQDLEKVAEIIEEIDTIWNYECEPFEEISDEIFKFYTSLPVGSKAYTLDEYITLKKSGFSGTSISLPNVPSAEISLIPKNICPKFSQLVVTALIISDNKILGKKENYPLTKEGNMFKLYLKQFLSEFLVKKKEKWEKITLQFIFKMMTRWDFDESILSLDQLKYHCQNKNAFLVDVESGDEKPLTSDLIDKITEKELSRKILRRYEEDSHFLRCKLFKVNINKEIPHIEKSFPTLGCVLTEGSIVVPVLIEAERGENFIDLNVDDFEFYVSNKSLSKLQRMLLEEVTTREDVATFPFILEIDAKKHNLELGNILKIVLFVMGHENCSIELPIIAQTIVKSQNTMELRFHNDFLANNRINETTEISLEIGKEHLALKNVGMNLWEISTNDPLPKITKLFIHGFENLPLYVASSSIFGDVSKNIKCFSVCETFFDLFLVDPAERIKHLEKKCSNFECWKDRSIEDLSGLTECPFLSSNCGVVTKDNELNVFLSFVDSNFFKKAMLEWDSSDYKGQVDIPLEREKSYQISLKVPEVSFEQQFIPSDLKIRLLLILANNLKTELEWENKYVTKPFDGFRSISRVRIMSYLRRALEDYRQQIRGPCEIIYWDKEGLWGIGYYKSINPEMSGIRI